MKTYSITELRIQTTVAPYLSGESGGRARKKLERALLTLWNGRRMAPPRPDEQVQLSPPLSSKLYPLPSFHPCHYACRLTRPSLLRKAFLPSLSFLILQSACSVCRRGRREMECVQLQWEWPAPSHLDNATNRRDEEDAGKALLEVWRSTIVLPIKFV